MSAIEERAIERAIGIEILFKLVEKVAEIVPFGVHVALAWQVKGDAVIAVAVN